MVAAVENSETRQQILRAALKRFAHSGYSAASVQHIVDDAKVSKPTLYYYFHDKAGLFQALVSEAHDERYRLMSEAAEKATDLRGQLVEILTVLFDYFDQNRDSYDHEVIGSSYFDFKQTCLCRNEMMVSKGDIY